MGVSTLRRGGRAASPRGGYCSQNGLSRSALGYWSRKIDTEGKGNSFVEIHSSHESERGSSSGAVELLMGERAWLQRLAGR